VKQLAHIHRLSNRMKYTSIKIIIIVSYLLLITIVPTYAGDPDSISIKTKQSLHETGLFAGFAADVGMIWSEQSLPAQVMAVINVFITFTGILMLVLIIYGGYIWMKSQGNEEQVSRAKKTIIAAVIGLSIVILARIITEIILYYVGQSA